MLKKLGRIILSIVSKAPIESRIHLLYGWVSLAFALIFALFWFTLSIATGSIFFLFFSILTIAFGIGVFLFIWFTTDKREEETTEPIEKITKVKPIGITRLFKRKRIIKEPQDVVVEEVKEEEDVVEEKKEEPNIFEEADEALED